MKRTVRIEPRRTHEASVRLLSRSWFTLREAARELGLSYEAARERYRLGVFRTVKLVPAERARPDGESVPAGGRRRVLIASCCVAAEKERAICECAADAA